MKRLIVLGILVGLGAYAYYRWSGPEAATGSTVRTAACERGTLTVVASASGTVRADVQVEVKSRASGEAIEVGARAGDRVEAGAILVRLDPSDMERALREAQIGLATAQARFAQAQAAHEAAAVQLADANIRWERRRSSHGAGVVSQEEELTAQTTAELAEVTVRQRGADVQAAEADVERANLAVEEAQRRLDETTIRAPVSGTVLTVDVERGSIVSSGITNIGGGTALLVIADLESLYVEAAVDEAEIGGVRREQEALIRVDAYPERVFHGAIDRVGALGTAESNVVTFDVWVDVTDESRSLLLPGMSADVDIITARHADVLLVPVAAIRSEGPQRYVLLASGERRSVHTGATDGVRVVVTDGLAEGDEIVVAGGSSDRTSATAQGPRMFGMFGGGGGGRR